MLLLLFLALSAGGLRQTEVPPRRPVAHLRGFQLDSRIVFVESEVEQTARLTCVFPQRARLWMRDGAGERFVLYRLGQRAFGLPPRTARSTEYEGEGALQTLRHLELRRALALYPDGFDWEQDGDTARALSDGAGALVATLGADGRPVRIEALDANGRVAEAFGGIRWREERGRVWPARAVLERGGQAVWEETFGSVETAVRVIDDFFLPPDRRCGGARSPVRDVLPIDLEPRLERRMPLSSHELEPALAEAAAARERATRDLAGTDWSVAPETVLELEPNGRPVALLLRLRERSGAAPPDGWTRTAEGNGLSVRLDRPAELDGAVHGRLLAGLPKGAREGRWYVRLDAREPAGGPCQVVLTLLPTGD